MNAAAVANGLTGSLVLWALIFSGLSVILVGSRIPLRLALPIVISKFLIVASYFGFWSDGSWFIGGDDQGYFETGLVLLETGENPLGVLFSPEGEYLLGEQSSVALYRWWNMLWLYLIGPSYFAPVLANVFVSVISACVFESLLNRSGFSKRYRVGFIVFFLLHWDVVAWTSFLNIKESLIVLILLVLLRSTIAVENRRNVLFNLSLILLCVIVFQGIRFYYPVLVGSAISLYWLSKTSRPAIALSGLALVGAALLVYYSNYINLVQELVQVKQFAQGISRMFLSPLPWKITDPATYLIPGSILHLVLLPGALFGAWQLFRGNSQARLIVLMVVVGLVFYALVPRLGSPRHRAPLMALWVLFEYQFLYVLLVGWLREKAKMSSRTWLPEEGGA